MTVRKKEEKEEKEKEKEKGGLHKNTSSVDLDNLLSLYNGIFHVPALPWLDIDESPSDRDRYIEVDEQELQSQYIEVPNSDSYSDFDYLLVGHAVMIEPVCHWERVVRTRTEVHGISVGVIEKDASG